MATEVKRTMGKLDELIKSLPKKVAVTEYGPVEGYTINEVTNYKGIPYAAAPEGVLRWRPPQPRATWQEPQKATRIGFVCPQDISIFPVFGQMGEDCLNLNIWAPEKSDGACTVMVWLHGGGFSTGSGSLPPYDGSYFASLGIVVVTINYRLNALGFLAHPELTAEYDGRASGNYGIMDQIFALQWVKKNIRGFGGDPDNVTVFGESAGGASVVALMSSPLTLGLFHRVIAQSPGHVPSRLRKLGESNGHLESAEVIGLRFAEKLGLTGAKGVIDKLRSLPAEVLAEAWFKMINEDVKGAGTSGGWMLNHLIVDGHVLQSAPGKIFLAGEQHNLPFMTGTTADEGTLFGFLLFGNNPDSARYHRYIERVYGESKDKVIKHFGDSDRDDMQVSASNLLGSGFYCGARRLARTMSAVQPQTYKYLFAMPPKFFLYQIPGIADWKERFKCFHAAEIPYVFHFILLPGLEDEDRALSDLIAGYWARFARTGDPNGSGAPHWPRYSQKDERYLTMDNPIVLGQGLNDKQCDFIDELEGM